jgi:hypothetical protein
MGFLQVSAVMQWLASLYSSAHDVLTDQSPMRAPASLHEEASPIMCNATPDSGNTRRTSKRAAENVQRALIKTICPLLPDFVVSCDISQMMQVRGAHSSKGADKSWVLRL